MRIALLIAATAAAAPGCSIEKKVPLTDGGVDSSLPDGPPDGQAPETLITAAPESFSRLGVSTFRFTSDDPEATFECSIDGDTPLPCVSPYTRTLGEGSHTFSVRAVDPAGNGDDTPDERVWTIDTVAPDTMILLSPPSADNSAMVRFEFRSNEANTEFECSLDSGAYMACTSGDMFGPLDDGAHSFAVRAKDRAGNLDASPAIRAWLVDTSTPDTVLLSGPSGATASSTATFTFVSPDAGSGATFQCSHMGAPFTPCTSPQNFVGLGAGTHTFAVRVRDAVGNIDPTPATRTWIVDLEAPETTILSGPAGLVTVASASFSFTSDELGVTFECALDGAAFAPCTDPFSTAGLAQGSHAFAVRARDGAGHVDGTPATRAWTVDTVPPDVEITGGPVPPATSGPRVTFAFSATEGAVTCSLDGAAFAPCASPLSFNAAEGMHELRVRATDEAGNAATATRTWMIDCSAPDPSGAAALLHLDDMGQLLSNAVGGGVPAVLGDLPVDEPADPSPVPAGRFGGGLEFSVVEGDRVAWPVALGSPPALAIELWVLPHATTGSGDLLVSGDDRLAIRIGATSGPNVRIFARVRDATGSEIFTATSGDLAEGAWHHVVVSLEEPVLRLWVDGARTETTGVALGSAPSLATVRLGGDYAGALDEVWIGQAAMADDNAALGRYCPP